MSKSIFLILFSMCISSCSVLQMFDETVWEYRCGLNGGEINDLVITSNGHLFVAEERHGHYHSSDGGRHWDHLDIGLETNFRSIFIDSSDKIYIIGSNDDILFSEDYGSSWERMKRMEAKNIFNPMTKIQVNLSRDTSLTDFIGLSPVGVDFYYPLTGFRIVTSIIDSHGCHYTIHREKGVIRYDPSNRRWSITDTSIMRYHPKAITSDRDNIIYVGTSDHGVFKSTDQGTHWVETGLTQKYAWNLACTSQNALLASAEGGVFISKDKGNTWQKTSLPSFNSTVSKIVTDKGGNIFVATATGIFHSADAGEHWSQIGLPIKSIYCILSLSDGAKISGSAGNIYRSTNNGETWTMVHDDYWLNSIEGFTQFPNGNLFARISGCYSTWFLKSTDNGHRWLTEDIAKGIRPYTDIRLDSKGNVYFGAFHMGRSDGHGMSIGNGVSFSSDQGESWKLLENDLPKDIITSLAINSRDDLFIGTSHGNVYRSTDYANSWKSLLPKDTSNLYPSILIGKNDCFFVLYSGFNRSKLMRSKDNGDTWVRFEIPGENSCAISIVQNRDHHLFLAMKGGQVYRSTDDGESWQRFSKGLKTDQIYRLFIDDDQFLYVRTPNDSYRTIKPTTEMRKY